MPRSRPEPTLVTPEVLRAWQLPEPEGGKNARGSVLVIGGSTETLGAVLLAAEAAMRAGAGKLQVATAASVAGFAAQALPEALVRALPETDAGAIAAAAADVVRDLAEAADAVLIGPGMADKGETQAFVERLLPGLRGPVALDALGLAAVTADDACLGHFGGNVVLTPNPTEIAYCLHVEESEIEDDPAGAAVELAGRAQAVVGPGRGEVVDRRPRRPALAGRQRRRGARRLRLRRRPRRDHRRAARPRGRPGPGRGVGRVPARPDGGAAGLRGGPAGLPGPRAAGRGAARSGGDHELAPRTGRPPARLRGNFAERGGRRGRQLHCGTALRCPQDRRRRLRRTDRGRRRRRHDGTAVEHLVRRDRPGRRRDHRDRRGLERPGRLHPALRPGLPAGGGPPRHGRTPGRAARRARRGRGAHRHGQRGDERRAHRHRFDRGGRRRRHAGDPGAGRLGGGRHPREGRAAGERRRPRAHPRQCGQLLRPARPRPARCGRWSACPCRRPARCPATTCRNRRHRRSRTS